VLLAVSIIAGLHWYTPHTHAHITRTHVHSQLTRTCAPLQVNDTDASDATHEQAIRLLTTSPDPLTLLVRHEPPPHGLNVCACHARVCVCECVCECVSV